MEEERIPDRSMSARLWSAARSILTSPYVSLGLRIYIGIVFITAGMKKIHSPMEFADVLTDYRLLPYWSINLVAVVLPWMELIAGIFLILGLRTKLAATILAFLLAVFTGAILINVLRGEQISCGCFGLADQLGWGDFFRDFLWLLGVLQIFFFDRIYLLHRGSSVYQKPQSSL
jgi:uncharacterized membrane protein YphA (DoxX/SURF4 family)